MTKQKTIFATFLFSVLWASTANAQLFNISATRTSNSQKVSASFNSAEDAADYLNGQSLNSAFGANVDHEAVTVNLNYRGLGASLAYDTGTNLTLNINGIVTNKVFSGATREDSVQLLKDFLKSDGGSILDQINKRLVAVSPSDPIAGNPISLMSQMVGDDFELAFTDSLHDTAGEGKKGIGNEMGAGAEYSHYNVSGINSDVVSLSPFSYRRNFGDSDVKLLLKIPVLKAITTEGAKTYQVSSSLGLHIPLYKDYWSIVPMASIGAVGSEDMASAAAMRGISATNKLQYKTDGGWGVHLGTLFGNYQTERLAVNGYSSNPQIHNNVLKNSVVLSIPTSVSKNYAVDLSATNSRFYGTNLYIDNMMDYGIGFVKTSNLTNNEIRLDLKYYSYDSQRVATIGDGTGKVRGISANLKFQY